MNTQTAISSADKFHTVVTTIYDWAESKGARFLSFLSNYMVVTEMLRDGVAVDAEHFDDLCSAIDIARDALG
jgi:hypothetical protein